MTILVFCLISLLLSLCFENKLSIKVQLFTALVPLISYVFVKYQNLSELILIFLILYCGLIGFTLIFHKKLDYAVKNFLIIVPWLLILFEGITNYLELIVFAVTSNILLLLIGKENILNNIKIVQYEANKLIFICLQGLLILFISVLRSGSVEVGMSSAIADFDLIFQYILLIFSIYLLDGFGSNSIVEKTRNLLTSPGDTAYCAYKLVLFPMIWFVNLKEILNIELILAGGEVFVLIIITMMILHWLDIKRRRYNTESYSIAIINLFSIVFIYLTIENFSNYLFILSLVFNYIFYLVLRLFKNKMKLRERLKLIFLITPLSPLFYVKTGYYVESTSSMNPVVLTVFTIFIFFPLMFIHKLRGKRNESI